MKKYLFFSLLMLISACAFTQNSRFYQLQAAQESKAVSSKKMSVGIEEVVVPRYLDRPQIVLTEKDSNELKVSEFDRWAEPLSSSITRVLADDIALYLPQSFVKPQFFTSEYFTYSVKVEINRFDAVMDEKVIFDAWWSIYKGQRLIARGRTKENALIFKGFDGIVTEQNILLDKMAKQIALKLSKL